MNTPNNPGESFPGSISVLPVRPGGKLSNASHDTSTTRPTRRGAPRSHDELNQCSAGVVADEGDVVPGRGDRGTRLRAGRCRATTGRRRRSSAADARRRQRRTTSGGRPTARRRPRATTRRPSSPDKKTITGRRSPWPRTPMSPLIVDRSRTSLNRVITKVNHAVRIVSRHFPAARHARQPPATPLRPACYVRRPPATSAVRLPRPPLFAGRLFPIQRPHQGLESRGDSRCVTAGPPAHHEPPQHREYHLRDLELAPLGPLGRA